jgi:hypothetical protein
LNGPFAQRAYRGGGSGRGKDWTVELGTGPLN